MEYRNLEKVRVLVKEATELDIMYAYDDLIFPEHGAFLIQYDDNKLDNFFCFFHEECNKEDSEQIFSNLKTVFNNNNSTIQKKGAFKMEQKGEDVEIAFS